MPRLQVKQSSRIQQQFAEVPRALLGYKQLNKTIRIATPIIELSWRFNFLASGVPTPVTEQRGGWNMSVWFITASAL